MGAAVALLAPATAAAHARLEGTSPPRGAVVKREPRAVVFSFDEPVEGNFGAVRVYDAGGGRVDAGDAFHPDGEGPRLSVHLKPGLSDGSYTATYRVVSADGHIVAGGYVFSIGEAGKAPGQTVGELIGGSGNGKVTEVAYGLARGLEYAALALAVGGVAFLLLCWLPALGAASGLGEESRYRAAPALAARLRVVLWVAAAIGLVATAAQIVLEGAEAAGISGFDAITRTIIEETLGTRFGTVWGLALVAWMTIALLVPLMSLTGRGTRGPLPHEQRRGSFGRPSSRAFVTPLIAAPLVYLILCPVLSGHGSSQAPVALNFSINAIHVGAMAVWLGGLGALLLVLPAATRAAVGAADRGRLLAGPLARFSDLALAMVALIVATGLIQAYVYVRHLDDLLATGYGRAVLAKFLLLLCVIGLAALNRRGSVPRLEAIAARGESPGRPGVLLRRALRAELTLLAVVIGVTAALAGYAPPVSAASGPFSTTTTLGPTTLELDVDPAQVGANQIHIYVFDAKTGAPYREGKELTVTATLPDKGIGPLPLSVENAGPGHYIAADALLGAPGDWRLDVVLRVSEFDQFEKRAEVRVG